MKTWLQIFFCLLLSELNAQAQEKDFLQSFVSKDTGIYWLLTVHQNKDSLLSAWPGIHIVRQLSTDNFIIRGKPFPVHAHLPDQIVPANHNWKLSPRLLHLLPVLPDQETHRFYIVSDSITLLKKRLQTGTRIIYENSHTLLIETSNGLLRSYWLPDDNVQYIDIADRKAIEEASINGFDYTLNHINTVQHLFPSFNGEHLIVSVKENRPDTADIDFKGRYIATNATASTLSSHATTMSTIISGGGNSFYTAKGVAPAATITSSAFDILLPDSDAYYRRYNISVQNHSYGTGIENFYGADAAAYDLSTISNPALVHVFSSGNAGDQAASTGTYNGLTGAANLTGSFKMAKNIITVGSSDSFSAIPILSSKGPAYDGRLKPDLVAYGEDGSSGAAALVSGTALLLQDIYKKQHADSLPDAALVKAVLLNSAADAGPPGIDFGAGYGNLDALQAAAAMNSGHFFSGRVAQGQQSNFLLTLPANAQHLKVMLCWMDPAAAPNAFTALINDLDLTVTSNGDQQQWLPWVLNSFPSKDSLSLSPVRKRDSLNTQEQVTVEDPPAADYTITVKGSRVITADQKFFVVFQWDTVNAFRWTYPTADDNILPGKQQLLRWNSQSTNSGALEYMIAGSPHWQTIESNVSPGSWFREWQAPDTNAVAILRMTINGRQYLSDSFTISAPLQPAVGYNCAGEALLYWNNRPGISYRVFKLGRFYLEPFRNTTDSFLVVDKTAPGTWFSIAPVLSFNKQGIRSTAFDYTTQGVDCYFSSFTADLINSSAKLALSLGSLYQVQRIRLEKMAADGSYHLWKEASVPFSLQYQLSDSLLTRGANYYRARIDLNNGTVIYSDVQVIYFTGAADYIVYPNPVSRPALLTIVATQPAIATLQLFTVYGQKVFEKKLSNLVEQLSTASLVKGIYFYVITENGKKASAGKLVVQ